MRQVTGENIPVLIKYLRKNLNLTQAQLADRVGVTVGSVNRWENGARVPMPFLVQQMVGMLDLVNKRRKRR